MGRKTLITTQHDNITLINIEGHIKETKLKTKNINTTLGHHHRYMEPFKSAQSSKLQSF